MSRRTGQERTGQGGAGRRRSVAWSGCAWSGLARLAAAGLAAAGLSAQVGLELPQHWAFVPPQRSVPACDDPWCRDDLDRVVFAGLAARGLRPAEAAPRDLLLRRVSLVLTGLPPTPDEIAAFVADDAPDAYERRVDALLASTACAEQLAVDWLDLARFADTYGYQSDQPCRTWPWRDWLIRAFAQDKPWDRFVREIVAGDLLDDTDVETCTATAFWRLHRQTNEGGSIEAEWRHEYIADRVDTFGAAFLGLTVGCARCHDHKSDPIRQRDYYALGTFFTIDESGLLPYSTGAVPQPALRLPKSTQERELAELQQAVATAEAAHAAVLATARQRIAVTGATAGCALPVATTRWGGGPREQAPTLDGDTPVRIEGPPPFTRADALTVAFTLWLPAASERAVLLNTTHYTLDADAQGYQLLLQHGHLCWQIVHHWPGSAIAVRTAAPLPENAWCHLVCSYDGSSRADGLRVYLDGAPLALEVERDHLAGPAKVRRLELGARDRDRGLAGGRIAQFELFDRCLDEAEVVMLSGGTPDDVQLREHAARTAGEVVAAAAALRTARQALHRMLDAIPELMVMAAHPSPPPRFVLRRGAYDQPDLEQPVTADVPDAILPFAEDWPRDRRGLAEWLLSPKQPLAARVVVDRLWAMCFGRGLVPTPEDFGRAGTPPVQQALLDLLAVDFAADRSVRGLLRRIVGSATFRQSSRVDAAQRAADPHNDRLGRGPSFRLRAETLRDLALAAAGLLHARPFGPSSKPWQPPGLWQDAGVGWGGTEYEPDSGPDAHRRSLYTMVKRTAPPPDMVVFDLPSRETCVVRRQVTDTPLQALVLRNDPVFVECATALARAVTAELSEATQTERLERVFVALAGRSPRPAELRALVTLCETIGDPTRGLAVAAQTLLASDAVVVVR